MGAAVINTHGHRRFAPQSVGFRAVFRMPGPRRALRRRIEAAVRHCLRLAVNPFIGGTMVSDRKRVAKWRSHL